MGGWTRGAVVAIGLMGAILAPWAVLAEDPFAAMKMSRVPAGTAAPSFRLTSLDGTVVASQDFAGKVLLVNFWATWCGPCKEEMPALARLSRQLDPQRARLVTITTDLQREGIAQFFSELNVQLPVLFDEDHDVSRAFMVRGLPTTVVIDPTGTVVARAVGSRAWDSAQALAMLRHVSERQR